MFWLIAIYSAVDALRRYLDINPPNRSRGIPQFRTIMWQYSCSCVEHPESVNYTRKRWPKINWSLSHSLSIYLLYIYIIHIQFTWNNLRIAATMGSKKGSFETDRKKHFVVFCRAIPGLRWIRSGTKCQIQYTSFQPWWSSGLWGCWTIEILSIYRYWILFGQMYPNCFIPAYLHSIT